MLVMLVVVLVFGEGGEAIGIKNGGGSSGWGERAMVNKVQNRSGGGGCSSDSSGVVV